MRIPRTGVSMLLGGLVIAGCGGGSSGLSGQQRLQTGQVCVDVAGSVSTAAQVGLKLANGSMTQADATARLQPIAKHVSDLATQNASLPVGTSLKQLADSISKVQTISPSKLADVQAGGTQLTTATKDLLTSCAAVRH